MSNKTKPIRLNTLELTSWDRFAASALAALITLPNVHRFGEPIRDDEKHAALFADSMIEHRRKRYNK